MANATVDELDQTSTGKTSSGTLPMMEEKVIVSDSAPDGSSQKSDAEVGEAAGQSHDGKSLGASLPKLRFILLATAVGLGFFLAILDTSIVATSLYAIAIEFREIETINWVALAYTLSYLSCAVMYARISDVVGRRVAFLVAYVIFIAFSLACGWSKSLPQLIAFRALQGVGGSGLYSLSMILLPEISPPAYQRYIAGIVGIVLAAAGVLGPLLGGILTQYATWRWVFWINGPIGGISAVVFYFAWPDPKYLPPFEARKWKEVDFFGSFLLVAAAVLIVFPFQNSGAVSGTWGRAIFLAPLLTGVACLVALLGWQWFVERRWGDKMAAALPMVLLRNRVYAAAALNTWFMGFPYLLSIYIFPLRFQVVNGKTSLDAGLMLLPMLAATAVGSAVGGALNGKKNLLAETLVAAGVLMIIGCALETTAGSEEAVEAKVLGFLTFLGFGFGLSATATTMIAVLESPIREHASAQGIIAQVRILGGSIGIAASSAILGVKMNAELGGIMSPDKLAHSGGGLSALSPEQQAVVRRVYTGALKEDMIVCASLLAAGVICALFVYKKDRVSLADRQRQRYGEEAARKEAAGREAKPEEAADA